MCIFAVCGLVLASFAAAQSGDAAFTQNIGHSMDSQAITIAAEINVTSPGEYAVNCSFNGVVAASVNLGNLTNGTAIAQIEVPLENAGKTAVLFLYRIEAGNWTPCHYATYIIPLQETGLAKLQIYMIAAACGVLAVAVVLALVLKIRRGKAVKEIVETSFRLRCPGCKQEFVVNDTGERPLKGKCPHCGKSGTVKK